MSTRVIATAMGNASYRRELSEKFELSEDPAIELNRLTSILGSRQLALPDLQQLISTPSASSVLSRLAPREFGSVRIRLQDGRRSALETTARDLQAELAEILAVAVTVVTTVTRDLTAETFAESGLDLGYSTTTYHAESATCVELRRGHEVVLVVVRNGGHVEFNHGGLADDICGEHQLQLERAAERRGVFLSHCPRRETNRSPLDWLVNEWGRVLGRVPVPDRPVSFQTTAGRWHVCT